MSSRLLSWSQPAEAGGAWVALAAAAVFLGAFALLNVGFLGRSQVDDTKIYARYGNAIARGQVPYRDFGLEYPPAALPIFAAPALGGGGHVGKVRYRHRFEPIMALCGAAMLGFMALALRALHASHRRTLAALGLAAVFPLILGSVVLTRFDLWAAALTAASVAALLSDRNRLGLAVLGAAFAAKVYPAVLLPLALVYVWRRAGRRSATVSGLWFAGIAALAFVPFLAVAPGGVWRSVVRQTTRPLQIESLGSSVLLYAHQLFGAGITMHSSHGSQNLAGPGANAVAAVQTVVEIVALLGVWVAFARGPAEKERLVRYGAAAVCAFVVFGKVLSPQFLIWLVPLVPLVRGRRGLAASGTLALAMLLTHIWFPYRYWRLALGFDPLASYLVLPRDLVLVALFAVLVWAPRARPAAPRSAAPAP
jgi:hypothetical protein